MLVKFQLLGMPELGDCCLKKVGAFDGGSNGFEPIRVPVPIPCTSPMRSMAFVPIIKLEVPLPGPVKAAIISAPSCAMSVPLSVKLRLLLHAIDEPLGKVMLAPVGISHFAKMLVSLPVPSHTTLGTVKVADAPVSRIVGSAPTPKRSPLKRQVFASDTFPPNSKMLVPEPPGKNTDKLPARYRGTENVKFPLTVSVVLHALLQSTPPMTNPEPPVAELAPETLPVTVSVTVELGRLLITNTVLLLDGKVVKLVALPMERVPKVWANEPPLPTGVRMKTPRQSSTLFAVMLPSTMFGLVERKNGGGEEFCVTLPPVLLMTKLL